MNQTVNSTPRSSASTVQGAPRNSGKLFMVDKQQAEENVHVVNGTFLVNDVLSFVLFDSGATHSFVSRSHAVTLGLTNFTEISERLVLPSGETISCVRVYPDVMLVIQGVCFPTR